MRKRMQGVPYRTTHSTRTDVDVHVHVFCSLGGSESSQEFCVLDTVTAHAVRLEQCELSVYYTARLVCVRFIWLRAQERLPTCAE